MNWALTYDSTDNKLVIKKYDKNNRYQKWGYSGRHRFTNFGDNKGVFLAVNSFDQGTVPKGYTDPFYPET